MNEILDQVLWKLKAREDYKQKSVYVVVNDYDFADLVEYLQIDECATKITRHSRENQLAGLYVRTTTAFPRGYVSVRQYHSTANPKYLIEGKL